jgi:inosine-uridine nucleoside N-ribohydrolase
MAKAGKAVRKTRKKIGASAPTKHRFNERSKANLKPAWQPGQSGNPAGRQKGSRNRLAEELLSAFCEAWEERGRKSLDYMILTDPVAFVRAAVALVPRHIEAEIETKPIYVISDGSLSMDEWHEKYGDPAEVAAFRARASASAKH